MKFSFQNIIILLSLWVLGPIPILGQTEYSNSFINYSNKDGFNQNTIFSIEQDAFGILWLGTANGLIKYDRNTFQNISWEPEHQHNVYHAQVLNITSDSRGLLWIVSENGLNIYETNKERFFKVTSDTLNQLQKTVEDADSSMWVFGNEFLYRANCEISNDTILVTWSPNLLYDSYKNLEILDLIKTDDNLYLIATSTGLYRMTFPDGNEKPVFEIEELIPANSINCLARKNNMVWVGTTEGLYKTIYDGTNIHLINKYVHDDRKHTSLTDNHITDLLFGEDNNLWIGTWKGGLSQYNEEDETFTNFKHDPKKKGGISSNMINCIFRDPFNVLWIGTAQAGLNKLDLSRKPFINFEHNPYNKNTIPSNLINCILEDSGGYLWISTYHSALSRSENSVKKSNITNLAFNRFEEWFASFPGKNILSIFEDDKGYIWLGYEENTVVVYSKRNNSFRRINFTLNGKTIPIDHVGKFASLDKDRILVGGSSLIILNNPWKYFDFSGEIIELPVDISFSSEDIQNITSVQVENQNTFWIGYRYNGLAKFAIEGDSLRKINHYKYIENDKNTISNNAVFCLYKDPDQYLWAGTFGGGLNRLRVSSGSTRNEFERLHDTIGLMDNAIYGIIEQNDSIIWCSTDMGITRLNTRSFETTNYSMYDGLNSNNFRMNAYHKGHSGFYYFGGLNGLTAFKPEQIKPNLIPPVIRITELKINNNKVSVGEIINNRVILKKHVSKVNELVLNREDKTISLGLTVYHSSIPEKNRLSYILEGFDKEWIEVDRGSYSATYTNLKPGIYTFRVRGYNCDGVISEEEASVDIKMLAPWYARTISKMIFVIISISIISGIFIYLIKLKNLQNKLHFEKLDNKRIKELNLLKLQFFTNISHEFKTPLSLISIPLQKLKEIKQSEETKEYLQIIEKNSQRLTHLIDQLLTFRKIEQGGVPLKVSETSMEDFIYPVANAFESLSLEKRILFYYQVKDPGAKLHLDVQKMEQVLFNLLSNAFKFTSSNGKVRLEGCIRELKNKQYACFDVTDNGTGIQPDDLDKIFDRFYQSDSELSNIGTGIGLSYSKSIVQLHKGTIKVESIPGKSTRFTVMIPTVELQTPSPVKNDIVRINAKELLKYEKISSNSASHTFSENRESPTVLIVDDEVEFRNIIKNVMREDYRILEASNGLDAMEIAIKGEADIIISDVMMPGMNGYDFCKKIKMDIKYCHIPFILLTALDEMDSHIQGVELGADSYISKPFDLRYLKVTVHKLIENREKLKQHFLQSPMLPSHAQISNIDNEFIKIINNSIQENLDNSSFGVEELAEIANLSTSQLYRKLKLLTGQIPNAYLRNYRLQAAAELLRNNSGISVKSVMFEVGIESASHFSHAFKKKFGCSPSDYS